MTISMANCSSVITDSARLSSEPVSTDQRGSLMSEATKGTSGVVACHCLPGCGCAVQLQVLTIAKCGVVRGLHEHVEASAAATLPRCSVCYQHGLGIELLPLAADVEDCKELLEKDFNFILSCRTELQ